MLLEFLIRKKIQNAFVCSPCMEEDSNGQRDSISDWSSIGEQQEINDEDVRRRVSIQGLSEHVQEETSYPHSNMPIKKGRKMSKPERSRSMLPPSARSSHLRSVQFGSSGLQDKRVGSSYIWKAVVFLSTCFIPEIALSRIGGMKTKLVRTMWREKVALCLLIFVLMGLLGILTFGLSILLCKEKTVIEHIKKIENNEENNSFIIHGVIYKVSDLETFKSINKSDHIEPFESGLKDISLFFKRKVSDGGQEFPCYNPVTGERLECLDTEDIDIPPETTVEIGMKVGYYWSDIKEREQNLLVFNGSVLDMRAYIWSIKESETGEGVYGKIFDSMISQVMGKDASLLFASLSTKTQKNIVENFYFGNIEVKTFGCIVTDVVLYFTFVIIFGVVLGKFFLAFFFSWFMARKLGMAEKDMTKYQEAPIDEKGSLFDEDTEIESGSLANTNIRKESNSIIADKMNVVILVTCYSESEEGLKKTFDSIANTDYPDEHKLLFITSDGLVKGSGNSKPTPEIVLSLLEIASIFPINSITASPYIAIAGGPERINQAKVYAGWYNTEGHRVPTVFVSKTGCLWEQSEAKPGNRGKRDSQIILMTMFSKALFDDRMTPLEYDIFRKIHKIAGIFPDNYDLVLMVDADTVIDQKSIEKMIKCMESDNSIIGICGETKISNKFDSWVTKIQVFEYYISHHMNKAFESIFGSVTCLPGCFSMYRIKVKREDGFWVPIIASPEIIDTYSKDNVTTLHEKNLLHLGEDRYMTTLILKTFPKRKLVFVPDAVCWTIVPDSFFVLLSQRRRWINSTIHNLFELVLVPEMCGIFCFSMKFVIFMELIGTLVLPAAIAFTGVLIVSSFVRQPQWVPIILLGAIFGLPAFLIFITAFKFSYFFWIMVYLISLPIWNGIFPLYSYWHFDDFTWGETRKISKNEAVTELKTEFQGEDYAEAVDLKRWHEWEYDTIANM
eukprot:GHVP01000727.1.p1 GENE.GHVP01000727.1~~GHVP01000727.1.p1  ORF type:complete len:956 (+),score=175.71 GHVP01000727.1:563-3430(+)